MLLQIVISALKEEESSQEKKLSLCEVMDVNYIYC